MEQYDYTGSTGASNYYGENNEYRNGRNRDRLGSSYKSGYRGDSRNNTDAAWAQDEGNETIGNRYGRSTTRGSYGSDSSSHAGSTRYDDDDFGSTRRHGSGGYGTANYGSSRYGGSRSSEAPYGRSYGRGNRYVISADTSDTGYGYEDDNEERGYGSDDYRAGLAIDETRTLISSRKVDGTAVYDRDGSRMGTIHNFMVNKRTGQVDYAVLSFGGILGMGTRYYPLPWQMLEYDTSHGGYVVDMDEDDLDEAPSFRRGEEPDFGDRYGEYVYGYYGMRY